MEKIEAIYMKKLKILEFSNQRSKIAFLVLASSGIRIGALKYIRIRDLEGTDNLYKIVVYSGDDEEIETFFVLI